MQSRSIFGPQQYIPIIKWKRGEKRALKELSAKVKKNLTPLIEIVSINNCVNELIETWGKDDFFFLDCVYIADEITDNNTPAPIAIYDEAEIKGLKFIPVISFDKSSIEIDSALKHRSRGICLRLTLDDLDNSFSQIIPFMSSKNLNCAEVDIILDMGSIEDMRLSVANFTAQTFITSLPDISRWRTLIITASAFPISMGAIQQNSIARIQRTEWLMWNNLYQSRAKLTRLPNFGDYGIQHPALPPDFEPWMQISANIRYTLINEWLILRAASLKKYGGQQYQKLASQLISLSKDYLGASHCAGCQNIYDISQGYLTPGNPEMWRKIGTIHHLTLTTEQLASVSFP